MLIFQTGPLILRTVLRTAFISISILVNKMCHCKIPHFKINLKWNTLYNLLYFFKKYLFLHHLNGHHLYINAFTEFCNLRQNRIHFLHIFSYSFIHFTKIEENITSFTPYCLHILLISIISSVNFSILKSSKIRRVILFEPTWMTASPG